jgi:hypothetical protein
MCLKTPQLGKLLPVQRQHNARWPKKKNRDVTMKEKNERNIALRGKKLEVSSCGMRQPFGGFLAAYVSHSALRTN